MNNRKLLRVGRIVFTNVWPIFHYFPEFRFEDRIEMITRVPTALNHAMARGDIDMGPISSFSYGENFEQYLLFPNLSVSAYGKVNSILLFYRKPFDQVVSGRIALPTTSATSVNLMKIIMAKKFRGNPEYVYAAPSLTDMLAEHDAALLIGDDAISARLTDHGCEVIDLGAAWKELTGCSMTFAVWAVRKQIAEQLPGLVSELFESFLESKRKAAEDPMPMIRHAQRQIGGSDEFWLDYFRTLQYDFDEREQEGLQLYFDYAHELGILPRKVPLQMWTYKKAVQVEE